MLVISIISTLKKVPSLSHMPDNVIMALIAVAALLAAVVIFILILLATDYIRTEQKDHKEAPDSHTLIMGLQKTLIDEMKGTSNQNKLMINLTIIFIIITILGILASVLGPERSMNFAKDLGSSISSLISQAPHGFRKAIGK